MPLIFVTQTFTFTREALVNVRDKQGVLNTNFQASSATLTPYNRWRPTTLVLKPIINFWTVRTLSICYATSGVIFKKNPCGILTFGISLPRQKFALPGLIPPNARDSQIGSAVPRDQNNIKWLWMASYYYSWWCWALWCPHQKRIVPNFPFSSVTAAWKVESCPLIACLFLCCLDSWFVFVVCPDLVFRFHDS